MALSEFEIKKCERAIKHFLVEHRPPAHIRNEVDIDCKINNQSVEIFEIRPEFQNPKNRINLPVAKATYVKTQKIWKIYWQRADLKWHSYVPYPVAKSIEKFFEIVGEDKHACFFC